ncbi:MAG: DUF349 domain-containing protein [Bacteroidaceae bacterium]|nr:DUF349 domain-containing protein [Bacteroidaceae bacterium]
MSETLKPDIKLNELNTPITPEQADNAATTQLSYEQPVEETTENISTSNEESENKGSKPASRQEIIERLQQIAEGDDILNCKAEIEALKVHFYKLRINEIEAERKSFVEEGGEETLFMPQPDALEEQFKGLMSNIKEKRNEWLKVQEERRQANYQTQLALLEELQELIEKAEQGNPDVTAFRTIQNRWKEIKDVPQASANNMWHQYQQRVEQFYDMLKLNHEFREYDFKKNLEIKTRICEQAEALANEEDVISSFRKLQQLHDEFRETGPVAQELREEIWNRFRSASTVINKRHQDHFEEKKRRENENLEQKITLCEEIENMDLVALNTYQAWNNATQQVLDIQARWKQIGFAPQKSNLKIFERFRQACDQFFSSKSDFFKQVKQSLGENLEKKRALCEKAESLKDSENWKETADILTQLQKEWKEIGAVPQKHSEALWKRFVSACDEFFERRNKATSSQRSVEQENLKKKKEIIASIKSIEDSLSENEQIKVLNTLTSEWNNTGHVPFKEKDKLYKEYRNAINTIYERLHVNANERKLANFRNNIAKGGNSLTKERDKLIRQYENMKAEIATYENNLGFLSTSNKKGESLLDVMRQKMEKLKIDAQVILKKIHLIEEEIEKE